MLKSRSLGQQSDVAFDVAQQRLRGASAAGIDQSRVSIEIHQINGGIVRSGQFRTANLVDLVAL